MQVSETIKIWQEYNNANLKDNTIRAYQAILSKFNRTFGDRNINDITSEEILSFLNQITEGTKQQTKKTRYSHLSCASIWDSS